jgi:cysteine synthase A
VRPTHPQRFANTGMPADHTRYYALGAFALGIVLTVTYNQQSKSAQRLDHDDTHQQLKQQQKLIARLAKIKDLNVLRKSLAELDFTLEKGPERIKEGIEGCIGDTPLIKIKSLSDYTGCEILAKAEVCLSGA